MFAGSCIGVILLVIALEGLRRGAQEYDAYIARAAASSNPMSNSSRASDIDAPLQNKAGDTAVAMSVSSDTSTGASARRFTPNILQQAIRALLHMAQFAVAYFIMLLAMYFNGYIIISIFIGAFIGFFIFGWRSVALP